MYLKTYSHTIFLLLACILATAFMSIYTNLSFLVWNEKWKIWALEGKHFRTREKIPLFWCSKSLPSSHLTCIFSYWQELTWVYLWEKMTDDRKKNYELPKQTIFSTNRKSELGNSTKGKLILRKSAVFLNKATSYQELHFIEV